MNRFYFYFPVFFVLITFFCVFFFVNCFYANSSISGNFTSYLIPVPNPCVRVEKIERGKVFLSDNSSNCVQVLSIKSVSVLPDENGTLEIFYKGKLWKKIHTGNNTEELGDYIIELGLESFLESIPSPGSKLSPLEKKKVDEAINSTSNYIGSDEFKRKVENYKDLVMQLLTGKTDKSVYSDFWKQKKSGFLSESERIYVFVSESIPVDTVRNFVREASTLNSQNVVFVMRGGIGGLKYISPTINWIYNILVKEKDCNPLKRRCEVYPVRFVIDPFLFRKYGISEVPAIVYVKEVKPLFGYSEGLVESGDFYVSYGDVSLYYHLYVIGLSSGNKELVDFSLPHLRF